MSLSDRCGATVEQVREELADVESNYQAIRAGLLKALKRSRADKRSEVLTKLAKEFAAERTTRLAEISEPYKKQRKRLQRFIDALEGEAEKTDEEPETKATEPEDLRGIAAGTSRGPKRRRRKKKR